MSYLICARENPISSRVNEHYRLVSTFIVVARDEWYSVAC